MSHAVLSPSSAHRWLTCTRSARLEENFSDRSGAAAEEGTLAHSLGELFIRHSLNQITESEFEIKYQEIVSNKLYNTEMESYCHDYADYVREQLNAARSRTKDAHLYLETKLDLTAYVPDGFGTGDAGTIADHVLDIIDLKYGKGVPVSAIKNKQMMLYALGALQEFDFLYDIHMVRMHIFQPRLDNISVFEMSVAELRQWAQVELIPKAAMAFKGEGDFAPGEACRFCKAKATCKANADFNLELAKYEFMDVLLMNDEDIADVLNRADLFTQWLKAVSEHALHEAVHNKKEWPGYKLVEGRSNRKYTDETLVLTALTEKAMISFSKITEPASLLPITKLEKAIGKPVFEQFVTPYLIKPAGKPTLVPASDKRPAYSSADAATLAFAEVVEIED